MRPVSIVGIGQTPVRKQHSDNLRTLGAKVVRAGMKDAMVGFSVNAHRNAKYNPNALFYGRSVTHREVRKSRHIHAPIRLLDCSPICEGAAAVVLVPAEEARAYSNHPVNILASSVATLSAQPHFIRPAKLCYN